MSDLQASVKETSDGFHVEGYESISHDFAFIDNVFDIEKPELAQCYTQRKRCLAVMDSNMFKLYGKKLHAYFDHYDINLTVHKMPVGEKAKSMETLLSIVDSMNAFGIFRKAGLLTLQLPIPF